MELGRIWMEVAGSAGLWLGAAARAGAPQGAEGTLGRRWLPLAAGDRGTQREGDQSDIRGTAALQEQIPREGSLTAHPGGSGWESPTNTHFQTEKIIKHLVSFN